MASTDAKPIPIKNQAYRVYFSIFSSKGDLVEGAAGLDSERSIDGGAFSDCTNEAIEIDGKGMYYLDLIAGEMNGDAICIIVQTSTKNAKTAPIVLYPQEGADIPVNVTHWNGSTVSGSSGYPIALLASSEIDLIWDELQSGHDITGSFGWYLDSRVSEAGGGTGTADWTNTEKTHIRNRLGIDGSGALPSATPTLAIEANVEGHVTTALNTYDPPTKAELDTTESNIRGADSDDLKTLSDQLDGVQTDLDNPNQYKADVSGLSTFDFSTDEVIITSGSVDAIWNELQSGHNTTGSFGYYLDSKVSDAGGSTGTTDWSSVERNQIRFRIGIDGASAAPGATPTLAIEANIEGHATNSLNTYDPPTHAELVSEIDDVQTDIAGLNDVSTAQVNAECDQALVDYDPPTHAELISEIDDVQTDIAGLNDLAVSDIFTGTLTEGYAADGSNATLQQILYMIWAFLAERSVAGTTVTVKKLDGATQALLLTLDDATNPTSISRTT